MELAAKRFVLPAICVFTPGIVAGVAFADPAFGYSFAAVCGIVGCLVNGVPARSNGSW